MLQNGTMLFFLIQKQIGIEHGENGRKINREFIVMRSLNIICIVMEIKKNSKKKNKKNHQAYSSSDPNLE